jgi:hypothetical protein
LARYDQARGASEKHDHQREHRSAEEFFSCHRELTEVVPRAAATPRFAVNHTAFDLAACASQRKLPATTQDSRLRQRRTGPALPDGIAYPEDTHQSGK